METWDKEAVQVDAAYLLPTVNEALLTSPVLVQAYSYRTLTRPTTQLTEHVLLNTFGAPGTIPLSCSGY